MKISAKRITLGVSLFILFLFALSYYSQLVYNAAINGKKSGLTARVLTHFSNFPSLVVKIFSSNELWGIPPTYIKNDLSFEEINHLTYSVYALNSFWDTEKNEWEIKLFNLKNDSVSYKWRLTKQNLDFSSTSYSFPNAVPRNCIIFPDKSIIVSADESANLMRLDSNSNLLWINHELIYHHSLELDADSNIWACASDLNTNGKLNLKALKNITDDIYKYKEDYITQIDSKTGKILFKKGVTEILLENHYPNFVYGFSDPDQNTHDPIHLNDVQPVLTDSPYWKKGDVFISIRHRSLVILYRPSTNKIIRLIFGEFINQHDVDIVSDSQIAIFNNNFIHREQQNIDATYEVSDTLTTSEIVTYNFKDSTFQTILKPYFIKEKIATETQGGYTLLANKDVFIESQNQGQIFIMNNSGVVLKKMLHVPSTSYAYHPNWIRIYEELPY